MAWKSSIYDHFIIWPSSVTLTLNLPEQMFQMPLLLVKGNNCAILLRNPCMNECMAWTSSIYDHFIIWYSSVSLTFNLAKNMFQMALLLLKENNWAKLLWNSCINVEVIAYRNLNGCRQAQCTHVHRTELVTTMSRSSGLNKNYQIKTCCRAGQYSKLSWSFVEI